MLACTAGANSVSWAADSSAAKPWYPLIPGAKHSYEETQDSVQIADGKTNTVHVTGVLQEEILPAPAHYKELGVTALSHIAATEQRSEGGNTSDVSGGYVQLWEWRQNDLYLHGVRIWIDGAYTEDMNLYQPPLLYLKTSAQVGERWAVGTQKSMGTELPTVATMQSRETVVVPAGTFSNCLKIVYSSTERPAPNEQLDQPTIEEGTVQDTIWFARDVGMVMERQLSTTTLATKRGRVFQREEDTKVLKSYTPAK